MTLRHLLLAFVLVMFHYMLIPSFDSGEAEASGVHCPDGYAYEVKEHHKFNGRYVRCEDFDSFMGHLAKSRFKEASRLLLKKQ